MNKKHKQAVSEALSKALEAPKRKPSPALSNILSEYAPTSEQQTHLKESQSQPTLPSPPSNPSQPSLPSKATSAPVAPTRDFMKVANSISRNAVPDGMFSGKGKQLYDYLYSLTRGAIVPQRSARVTREQLMKGSGIGAKVTLEQNIARLKRSGLIEVVVIGGIQGGNEYKVNLPEEVGTLATLPSHPTLASLPSNGEKLGGLGSLESRESREGVNVESTQGSTSSQTLIKTNTERSDDDDAPALTGLNATLKQVAEEVTGREVSSSERERWNELAEVLATELRIAAARTTVSSAPSFLAEHLRRRLWKKDKRELQAETSTSPQMVASTISPEQMKSCQDCGGTGFKYKGENFTGGVEKCRHENLVPDQPST